MTDGARRVFLSPPHMSGSEARNISDAFVSNYIAPMGPMVNEFEREFGACTGIPHCLALASGTAAMHLAVRHILRRSEVRGQRSAVSGQRSAVSGQESEGGGRGAVVLASTLTFIGSVTPATFEGCELRFIDSGRDTWNMDPGLLEDELAECQRESRQIAAVIPTDLYGQCCNLPRIRAICDKYGVPVICDSAEAVGARYQESGFRSQESEDTGQRSAVSGQGSAKSGQRRNDVSDSGAVASGRERGDGPQGPRDTDVPHSADPRTPSPGISTWRHAGYGAWAAVYSFNGNKIITTSGGGMLASHDKDLIDHARKLSQQARDPAPWYEHSEIGFNYRMSNVLAAIGRGQLQVLDDRVRRRREIFEVYRKSLGDLPGISFMPEPAWSRSNRWLTVVLIDDKLFGATPDDVRNALEAENIESRPIWKPMHLQPVFAGCQVRGGDVAEDLFKRGLCLPSGTAMTDADVERVAGIVRAAAQ